MTPAALMLLVLACPHADPSAPARLLLADSGKALAPILVHKSATPAEFHAAQELARFLQEITGAPFPVTAIDAAPTGQGPTIRVGPGAAAGLVTPEEIARLGPEGTLIRTRGDTLVLAGGPPRGTLYAVYSFLDNPLGCRWFTPDVSRIPKQSRLELSPLDRTFVPRLEQRALDYPHARNPDWAARNHVNGNHARLDARHGGKIAYGPFVHTFDSILNPKDHFAQHPEYFSEVNGKRMAGRTQLCVTNPDVQRIAIDTVRRWMKQHPDATIFSVSQNDWYNFCTCPECARIAKEEGAQVGPYLRLVNAVADAVRDEFPGKAVDTLAYQFTRQPPAHTVPRPNVIVRLCSIECCFSHPLAYPGDKENAAFASDLRRWGRLSDRLYIWDYVINFGHALMPFPNLYVLRPNIQFFLDNGVKGIYEESCYFTKGGELAELRAYLLARTLWDPATDTDQAIDEFLDGYYGTAAPALRRYIDLIHGKAKMDAAHFHIFDGPKPDFFTDDLVTRAESLFDQAEKAAADKPAVLHRVQVARLPITYVRIHHLLRKKDRSPGDSKLLATLFARFDATARKEGVTHVSEGRSYTDWSAAVRKSLPPAP